MEKFTKEQLEQKAQEILEKKKNPEIGEPNIERLTNKEEKIKKIIAQINLQDNDEQKKEIEKNRLDIKNLNDERAQLEALIKMCFTKGPNFAIKVAQSLSDNVLDSLHAILVKNEVYEQLKEKNII